MSYQLKIDNSLGGRKLTIDNSTNGTFKPSGYNEFLEVTSLTATSTYDFRFDYLYPMLNSETMVMYREDGTTETSTSAFYNVVLSAGEVIKFRPLSGDWSNVRCYYFITSDTTAYFSFTDNLLQYKNAYVLDFRHTFDGEWVPAGMQFPNMVRFYRVQLPFRTRIDASTFSQNFLAFENNQYGDTDTMMFQWYPLLNDLSPRSWDPSGNFDDVPADRDYVYLNFNVNDNKVIQNGDIGEMLNRLDASHCGIVRFYADSNYDTSVAGVSVFWTCRTNGSAQSSYGILPLDVSTLKYAGVDSYSSVGLRFYANYAIGQLTEFDESRQDNVIDLDFEESIVEGDLAAYNNIAADGNFGIYIQKSRVIDYTKSGSFKPLQLTWHSCIPDKDYGYVADSSILESTLVDLIDDKFIYATNNDQTSGYLHIASTNPTITDASALYQIELLTTATDVSVNGGPYDGSLGYGWTIYVNT